MKGGEDWAAAASQVAAEVITTSAPTEIRPPTDMAAAAGLMGRDAVTVTDLLRARGLVFVEHENRRRRQRVGERHGRLDPQHLAAPALARGFVGEAYGIDPPDGWIQDSDESDEGAFTEARWHESGDDEALRLKDGEGGGGGE